MKFRDYAGDCTSAAVYGILSFVVEKALFIEQVQFPVQVFENLVGIGQEHKESNGFSFKICIPDQFRIHYVLDLSQLVTQGSGIHRGEILPEGPPGLVVNRNGVFHKLFTQFRLKMLVRISLSIVNPFRNFPESFREGLVQIELKTKLFVL